MIQTQDAEIERLNRHREVKPSSADGTALERRWGSGTLPHLSIWARGCPFGADDVGFGVQTGGSDETFKEAVTRLNRKNNEDL